MGLVISFVIIGFLLLFAEILIIPGVGVAGILGLLSLVGSCVYAFWELGNVTGAIVTSCVVVALVGLTIYVLRAKTWKRVSLNTNIDSKAITEIAVNVGDEGRTVTRLAPMGQAVFGGEPMEVKAFEGMINPNVDVVVVMIEDNKIYVKPKVKEF